MDDLLAQIFGVLRDERAELQSQPPGRHRNRTPVAGAPAGDPANGVPNDMETGPVPRTDLDTGPVIRPTPPALDPPDGIVSQRADTDLSGAVHGDRPDSQPGDHGGVLDPPAPSSSGIRPIYPVDEVTPPSVDIEELARGHQAPKR
jgi:hypothetical protein